MPTFRFMHASDLHLDTPFEGIGRVPAGIAETLRDASLHAWDALVERAIEREVAFVLIAGGTYDGPERGVRGQLRFLRGLERLDGRGIQTLIALGPSDPAAGWPAVHRWPASVTIFPTDRVAAVRIEREGSPLAVVYGTSFDRADLAESLARCFARGEGPGIHIGVLACGVSVAAPAMPPESPCSLDDLISADLDYWALGGQARRQILCEKPCWAAASGTPQGRSPRPEECGPQGALIVEVEDGTIARVVFEPLDHVRLLRFELNASAVDDGAALRQLLVQKLAEIKAENQGRALLVRAVLRGSGGVHAALARPDALADLVRELREETEDESPPVWWDSVIDKTRPDINRDAVRRRNDFSAELLRQSETLRQAPAALAAFLEERAKPLNRLSARRAIADPDPAELDALAEEAEDLALDLLEGAQEP